MSMLVVAHARQQVLHKLELVLLAPVVELLQARLPLAGVLPPAPLEGGEGRLEGWEGGGKQVIN